MSNHHSLPDDNTTALIAHLQQKLNCHREKQAAIDAEVSALQLVSDLPPEQKPALTVQDKQAVVDMLQAIEHGEFDGVTRLK